MIWLASFPRSGNTFMRNVFSHNYGLQSFELQEKHLTRPAPYRDYPVVKTHLRPSRIKDIRPQDKVVLLVRDGRDALISIAHHRKDIIEPNSNFEKNLEEAIRAQRGSFFGGWSRNILEWASIADIIIKFEDLVNDPIRECERLRKIIPGFPQLIQSAPPTLDSQRKGQGKYGPISGANGLFFRKGQIGYWKTEMPQGLHQVFWKKHGHAMRLMGYSRTSSIIEKSHLVDLQKPARSTLRKKYIFNWLAGQSPQRRVPQVIKPTLHPKCIIFNGCPWRNEWLIEQLCKIFHQKSIAQFQSHPSGPQLTSVDRHQNKFNGQCDVVITDVPYFILKQHLIQPAPIFITACIEDPMTSIPYQHQQTALDESLDTYIIQPKNRNSLSQLLSPFSNQYLNLVIDVNQAKIGFKTLAEHFQKTINIAPISVIDQQLKKETEDLIQTYNKPDIAIFNQLSGKSKNNG